MEETHPSTNGNGVTFTTREMFDRIDHKLDLIDDKLEGKADRVRVHAIANEVMAVEGRAREVSLEHERRLVILETAMLRREKTFSKRNQTAIVITSVVTTLLTLLLFAGNAKSATRHDRYPLHPGSAGPRVCNLQWLLGGHKPSVWRSPRYRIFKGEPGCFWRKAKGSRTSKSVWLMKYRLGWPKYALDNPKAGKYFVQLMLGKVRRPKDFVARSVVRLRLDQKPQPFQLGAPLTRRPTICGVPGVGTHSYWGWPNNWQSDRALDLCVAYGTPVLAVGQGSICSGCGFGSSGGGRFAGMRFTLNLSSGDQVYYAHLSRVTVGPGRRVFRGGLLGYSGSANGVNHLHIACRVCNPYSLE